MEYIDFLHEEPKFVDALIKLLLGDELICQQEHLIVFLLLGELGLL